MRPLVAFVVVGALLAGCSGARDDDAPTLPGAPTFALDDPRLPRLPDGTLDPNWTRLSTLDDPGFPLFHPMVPMNTTFGAGRETSLAIFDQARLACDPSGVPNLFDGQSYFYASEDGGATWRDLVVEGPTDTRRAAFEGGDCDVAIGPDGTWWTADTWLGSLSVGASRDAGATWTGTSMAASAPIVDRPWLATDAAGTLHVTYQDVQFAMPSAIWYTRVVALDGALAFQPVVPVATATPQGPFTWTGNLVVSDDGNTLWSVYTRRARPVTNDLEGSGPEGVWVARSVDAGLTWQSVLVSQRPNPASFLYPSLARDAGGILHVVFAQRTDSAHPVWHAYSLDDGTTWSEPAIVRDGVGAYSPWVAGGAAGRAAIQFFASPDPQPDLDGDDTAWYTYWAHVNVTDAGATYRSGTTTRDPAFVGDIGERPEFNQVRVDAEGAMHLGLSIPFFDGQSGFAMWRAVYQAQVAGPTA